jgi:hypothetical protein
VALPLKAEAVTGGLPSTSTPQPSCLPCSMPPQGLADADQRAPAWCFFELAGYLCSDILHGLLRAQLSWPVQAARCAGCGYKGSMYSASSSASATPDWLLLRPAPLAPPPSRPPPLSPPPGAGRNDDARRSSALGSFYHRLEDEKSDAAGEERALR